MGTDPPPFQPPPIQPPPVRPPPPVLPPTGEGGISNSRVKVVWSIFLFLTFAAIVMTCGGIINPRWVGWCLLGAGAVSILLAIMECGKLFSRSQVIVFSKEGLFDHSEKPGVFIKWRDIRKVTLWTFRVNGVPGTRALKLDVVEESGKEWLHEIGLDTLKGNPKVIAQRVMNWVNQSRAQTPMVLQEAAGDRE